MKIVSRKYFIFQIQKINVIALLSVRLNIYFEWEIEFCF